MYDIFKWFTRLYFFHWFILKSNSRMAPSNSSDISCATSLRTDLTISVTVSWNCSTFAISIASSDQNWAVGASSVTVLIKTGSVAKVGDWKSDVFSKFSGVGVLHSVMTSSGLSGRKYVHSVMIKKFLCHSDFMWNQFDQSTFWWNHGPYIHYDYPTVICRGITTWVIAIDSWNYIVKKFLTECWGIKLENYLIYIFKLLCIYQIE